MYVFSKIEVKSTITEGKLIFMSPSSQFACSYQSEYGAAGLAALLEDLELTRAPRVLAKVVEVHLRQLLTHGGGRKSSLDPAARAVFHFDALIDDKLDDRSGEDKSSGENKDEEPVVSTAVLMELLGLNDPVIHLDQLRAALHEMTDGDDEEEEDEDGEEEEEEKAEGEVRVRRRGAVRVVRRIGGGYFVGVADPDGMRTVGYPDQRRHFK